MLYHDVALHIDFEKKGSVTLIDMGSTEHALTKKDFVSNVMEYTEGGERQNYILQVL